MRKKFSFTFVLALLFAFVLAGCSNQTASKPADDANNQFQSEIKFFGSTTLAPVISQLSTEFNEEHGTWDKVDSTFEQKDIAIYVAGGGSSAGVKSVIDGVTDFGMVSRTVKDEEKKNLGNIRNTNWEWML